TAWSLCRGFSRRCVIRRRSSRPRPPARQPAMNDQAPSIGGDLRLIPLSDLALSPLNSRQQVAEDEIEAMAESIAIAGLLQNLIGIETAAGAIEIVGGGKRLRALQKLASEGWRRKTGQ